MKQQNYTPIVIGLLLLLSLVFMYYGEPIQTTPTITLLEPPRQSDIIQIIVVESCYDSTGRRIECP